MKKFLVAILAFSYISVSSGATVNMHFCMGKLMNWDLKQKQDGKCGSCGMEKTGHKGCCKDKQTILKIEKDQKVSESVFQSLKYNQDAIISVYPALPLVHLSSIICDNPLAHAPPRTGSVPVFILHCNFRI